MPEEIIKSDKKTISFSQYTKWFKCPHRWMWDFIKGKRTFEDTIHTCFGTAIHEVVQLYIKTLYTESLEKAESYDLVKMFKEGFQKQLTEKKVKHTEDEFTEFFFDGEDILKCFLQTTNRIKYFPTNGYEFIDVEMKMDVPVKNNVNFIAFIDLILKDKKTGNIKIIDIKTSTNGWNQYQKLDETKYAQVLIYKALYAKQFNVPLHKIEVEFFILKRRLYENVTFPQSRIQNFIPTNTSQCVNKVLANVIQFLNECFNPDGTYKTDESIYYKNPGKDKKNCKYCSHYKIHCDGKIDSQKS